MAALIETASGRSPLFVGKPNPLMMRTALNYLGVHSEDTVMIGDRMETDIYAGVTSGMETILVLTGVTQREDVELLTVCADAHCRLDCRSADVMKGRGDDTVSGCNHSPDE